MLLMRRGSVVEPCMIRRVCEMRLADRVSSDVLCDRAGVAVKIENIIIQSRRGAMVM